MKVLITGAGGMLARALRRALADRDHDVVALERGALDVTDAPAVDAAIRSVRPEAVVQCAAYTRVDDAESEEACAHRVNAVATGHVARACRAVGARFLYPSTDYVFDGRAAAPYATDSPPHPLGAYGRSKLAGEEAAREAGDFLIVRTSWLYGAGGRNFVASMLAAARAGRALRVVDDQRGAPTWTGTLAGVLAQLLECGAPAGVYHATNRGETTWYGLAREAIRLAGLDAEVTPVSTEAWVEGLPAGSPRPAPRPRYSVLDCTATETLVGPIPAWRDALAVAVGEGV
ncbi:MAG TPA: dTDP-4-dehydrorhamnose reductase [Longimicrobiales bacterium]